MVTCLNIGKNIGKPIYRSISSRAGRYTGSYRIPVFIFLTIWIFKIPQYRCHLNNVWNATLLERGLFSLLHFGEDTAVCVTMWKFRNWSTSRMWWERRSHPTISTSTATISTIRMQSAPASLTNSSFSGDTTIPVNCRVPAFLNSLFITLRP